MQKDSVERLPLSLVTGYNVCAVNWRVFSTFRAIMIVCGGLSEIQWGILERVHCLEQCTPVSPFMY